MEIKFKVLALAAITVIGLAMPLSAQESNQSTATAGVFSTDVDNYMNVNYYDEVDFNKWFGYVGSNTGSTGIFNLGFATSIKGIYLGTYYTGYIIKSDTDKASALITTWDPVLQQMLTRTDVDIYDQTTTNTNNHIAALVGLKNLNMGIKVGFYEDMTTYNTPYNAGRECIIGYDPDTGDPIYMYGTSTKTQNDDGSITYLGNDSISYEQSKGDMIPYLQWGMKLKLGSYLLAPRAGIGVNFYEDKLIDEYYSVVRTEYQGNIVGEKRISREGYNNGYTGLNIGVGADFYLNESMYAGIDYYLRTNLYSQSYDAAGGSGSVDGTISWDSANNYSSTKNYYDRTENYNSVEIAVTERSYMSHQIIPAFWKEWKEKVFGENVKVGVLVQLPITIASRSESNYTDRWETDEITYNDANYSQYNTTTITETHTAGTSIDASAFSISPAVGVGASYDLIPKRFTINAGVKVYAPSYTSASIVTSKNGVNSKYTKTETGPDGGKYTSWEDSDVTAPTPVMDSVQTITSWTGLSGYLSGGFVFNFNDNFSLDLLAGVSLGGSSYGSSSSYGIYSGSGSGGDLLDGSGAVNGTYGADTHDGAYIGSGSYAGIINNKGSEGFNINLTTVNVLFTIKF